MCTADVFFECCAITELFFLAMTGQSDERKLTGSARKGPKFQIYPRNPQQLLPGVLPHNILCNHRSSSNGRGSQAASWSQAKGGHDVTDRCVAGKWKFHLDVKSTLVSFRCRTTCHISCGARTPTIVTHVQLSMCSSDAIVVLERKKAEAHEKRMLAAKQGGR